ncbi:MAG TPA: alcohol dehydrogenase [Acidimicrobiaceae bacterium]|nr:alcohol dehydrogenase [Acidimicrobiaceae bacterium]
MRAAVLNSIPGELEITDVGVDKPGPREVLLRTAAAGLCHSDLHFMEGKYPYATPVVMGHESAGIVEQVGRDVSYVSPGDHVITCLSVFCGHCSYCTEGRPALCSGQAVVCNRGADESPRLSIDGEPAHQFLNLSSFAEMMLVHENALVKIREDMPLDRAALIGCGVMTGVGAAFRTADVRAGETVAVLGAGGVGLSAIQGARIAGAGRIIALDPVESKLEVARQMGATDTIDVSAVDDPVAAVMEMTGGGVHKSFEAVGLKDTAEQAFRMLRVGGTATVIGMIPFGTNIELHGFDFLLEKKIQGSTMGSNQFRTDMPRLIDMYLDGRLKLDEMVSARIELDKVNDGFEAMKAATVTRSVIEFV